MGYTTDFIGSFNFNKPLDDEIYNLLIGLSRTRRMKRKGLDKKYGVDGEFFYNEDDMDNSGQTEDESIVDYNTPPRTQPSLWLQWIPTEDRLHLEWDGGEKFYNYVEWLEYLIEKIFEPHGFKLNGEVEWEGEDSTDRGKIVIKNNVVKILKGKIVYDEEDKLFNIQIIKKTFN